MLLSIGQSGSVPVLCDALLELKLELEEDPGFDETVLDCRLDELAALLE